MCELTVFPKSSDWCFKARKDSQWFKTAAQIADSQTEQYSSLQRSDFAAWTNPFTFNFKPSRVQSLTSFRFHSMNKSKTVLLGALTWLSYFWSLCKQLFSELNFTVSTVDRQFELSKKPGALTKFGALRHGQMDQGTLPPCYSRYTVPSPGRRQIVVVT